MNFLPDDTIFEKTKFKAEEVKSRLHETAYLNPELTIIFEDLRGTEPVKEEYHEPEGIVGYIRDMNHSTEALHEPVYLKGEADGIQVEVAFQYTNEFRENVLGFCNNIYNAEGGTHLTGFKTTFTTVMNTYAREIGILKDKDPNFTGADIRNGMTAVVSIKHPAPRFEGQTKTKLDNQDAAKATGKVLGEQLVLYFDRNLETLKTILSCAEKAAKIRKTEERAKTNLLTKQKYSFDSNGKLANCEKKDPSQCEIFIVEGDSAGGSAKTARDRNYQAILPIRGKILNVEKATIDKVLANAEIKTMINAFGCGFSEGYFSYNEKQGLATATQVEADDRRTIQRIKDIRDRIQAAVDDLIQALNDYADIYDLAPYGTYTVAYNFGDITYSYEEDRQNTKSLCQLGVLPWWMYLVRFEGFSEDDAKAAYAEANTAKPGLFPDTE